MQYIPYQLAASRRDELIRRATDRRAAARALAVRSQAARVSSSRPRRFRRLGFAPEA